MKKLDAELVLINPDATEAERLDCAKFYRQQVRSYLTRARAAPGSWAFPSPCRRARRTPCTSGVRSPGWIPAPVSCWRQVSSKGCSRVRSTGCWDSIAPTMTWLSVTTIWPLYPAT